MSATAASDAWIMQARSVPIENEIARRGIKLRRNGKELIGPCPRCGGDDRFAINTAKQVFNCRGCEGRGDVIDLVMFLDGSDFIHASTTLAGEPPKTLNGNEPAQRHDVDFSTSRTEAAVPKKVIAAKYKYQDELGNLAFGVARIEYYANGTFVKTTEGKRKKTFLQGRPDPEQPSKWVWSVNGAAILPYRLPELVEAIGNGNFIVVAEGEAKVDLLRSWNVPATCCAGGAKKWRAEHSEFLRGADVVILPDNDEAGRAHCDVVGASLVGVANSIKVLDLPGLPPKGDIVDWASRGGTVEQFHTLIAHEAKPWTPTAHKADEDQPEPNATKKQAPEQKAKRPDPEVINAEELNRMRFDPIKYVVPGYIVEGLTLFAGKPKIGKSWLLLHAAAAVGEGGYTLGNIHCEQGDVLYAALEDNRRRLPSRMTKLFGTSPWPPRLSFTCEMPRLADGGLAFIRKWIEGADRPRLVIIDTLAMVRMPNRKDQNSYDADYAAVRELRDLGLTYGIAVMLVHHLRKAEADDPFDTISGTLGLTGAPDTIMVIKRDASGTMLHARGRDLIEIEKSIKFDAGTCTWSIMGDADVVRQSAERAIIIKAMEEAGEEALGPRQIAEACGMKAANVRRLLSTMKKDGIVKNAGTYGKYALVRSHSRTSDHTDHTGNHTTN